MILFAAAGSLGDLNPFLAIAVALRSLGERVVFMAPPHDEPHIRGASLEFRPLVARAPSLNVLRQHPELMNGAAATTRVMRSLVFPHILDAFHSVSDAIAELKPDAACVHPITFGAHWALQQASIPTAVGCVSPTMWLSTHDQGVYAPFIPPSPDARLVRTQLFIGRTISRFLHDPSLRRARRALGLSPARDIFMNESRSGDLNLGLWSPSLRAPMPDDPPRACVTGFARFDSTSGDSLSDGVQRFLDVGPPPIAVALGTTAARVGSRVYAAAARACASLGRRAIIIGDASGSIDPSHSVPRNTLAVSAAPFSLLFPCCEAVIHHGGAGTTAQTLVAGKPSVVVPFAFDQFDNAARLHRAGVAMIVQRPSVNTRRLAHAIDGVLRDRSCRDRAVTLGLLIRDEDGASVAAAALMQLM